VDNGPWARGSWSLIHGFSDNDHDAFALGLKRGRRRLAGGAAGAEHPPSFAYLSAGYGWYRVFQAISRAIILFFGLEIMLKIYALSPKEFFASAERQKRINNWIDFVVVWTSIIIEFILYSYIHDSGIIIVLRFWRIVRIFHGIGEHLTKLDESIHLLEEMSKILKITKHFLVSKNMLEEFEEYEVHELHGDAKEIKKIDHAIEEV